MRKDKLAMLFMGLVALNFVSAVEKPAVEDETAKKKSVVACTEGEKAEVETEETAETTNS